MSCEEKGGKLQGRVEYSFNTCGELVDICCVMKALVLQFLPPKKKQSDDRCVSAEKIIVQVVCQGVFVTVNKHFVGYSVSRDLQGEVRSRWVPGANGEKLRDRSTSKFFHKMINFQFIPRAGISF